MSIYQSMVKLYTNIDEKFPTFGYLIRRLKHKQLFNTVTKNISGQNNTFVYEKSILSSVRIEIKGNHNKIIIGKACYINNVDFYLIGDNHTIEIGDGIRFNRGGSLWMEDSCGTIIIGKNSSFENVHLAVTEPASQLVIGDDCMLAYDIDIRTGDSHSIIDWETKKRLNYAQNVIIGNHVWITAHCSILKGATIPDHCVIATRSVNKKV